VQLDAVQPVQDEDEADLPTVSPPLPLLTNPQADIMRHTWVSSQWGQWDGSLPPSTRCSKFRPHALQ
jgi:hypothetical protein